jgi:hypothetical protein
MDHARQGGSGAASRHDAQPPRAKHDTLEAGRAAQRGHESGRVVLPALTLRRPGPPAARARIRRPRLQALDAAPPGSPPPHPNLCVDRSTRRRR